VRSALALALLSIPAAAQGEISADAAFLSDYRDRGLSLSDTDATGLAGVEAGGRTVFGGLVSGYVQDLAGRDLFVGGYIGASAFVADAYDVSLTLYGDSFHGLQAGEDSQAFFEARATIARDVGLIYARVGVSVAPAGRWSDPDDTVLYPFLELQVPVPRAPWLTLVVETGYSAVFGGPDRADWRIGLNAGWKGFDLFAGYTDTSTGAFGRLGRATGLVELRYYF